MAAALIALQYVIFVRTQIGRRLRATAQDRQMAQAIGIRTSAVIAATFGFGTALAGVAGALLANQFFVYPTGGISLSVYAYIAVVVGGWGSIAGAVIGAHDDLDLPSRRFGLCLVRGRDRTALCSLCC